MLKNVNVLFRIVLINFYHEFCRKRLLLMHRPLVPQRVTSMNELSECTAGSSQSKNVCFTCAQMCQMCAVAKPTDTETLWMIPLDLGDLGVTHSQTHCLVAAQP